jgi:hypothetical protein
MINTFFLPMLIIREKILPIISVKELLINSKTCRNNFTELNKNCFNYV